MGTHNIEELDAIDDEIKEAEDIKGANRLIRPNADIMRTKLPIEQHKPSINTSFTSLQGNPAIPFRN